MASAAKQLQSKVLGVWFKNVVAGQPLPQTSRWFEQNAEFDQYLTREFGDPLHDIITTGKYTETLQETAKGSLSLVILLDQISRNIYRNSPRCFVDADPLARKFTKAVFARGFDQELDMIERVWFYMPLEHSEDKADHELCITKFEMAVDNAPEIHLPFIENMFKYAKDHKVVIDKFGRYPHRNRILGRVNTPEEEEWLKTGKGW